MLRKPLTVLSILVSMLTSQSLPTTGGLRFLVMGEQGQRGQSPMLEGLWALFERSWMASSYTRIAPGLHHWIISH